MQLVEDFDQAHPWPHTVTNDEFLSRAAREEITKTSRTDGVSLPGPTNERLAADTALRLLGVATEVLRGP